MNLRELIHSILASLTPSEQAVYLRLWHLSGGQGKCAVRYEDLANSAHVSRSTLKRTLKTLAQRKLIKVTLQAKHASLFDVFECSLASKKVTLGFDRPRLYDFFSEEDRALFLSCKRGLSPAALQEIAQEAEGDPLLTDMLIFRRSFGAERQKKYAALVEKLTS